MRPGSGEGGSGSPGKPRRFSGKRAPRSPGGRHPALGYLFRRLPFVLFLTILLPGWETETQRPLVSYQRDIVRHLTGGAEIAPGITLEDRASPRSRELTRRYLEEELRSLGLEPRRQAYREEGANVYALLRANAEEEDEEDERAPGGSPPETAEPRRTPPRSDEYVVIGAHLDSVERSPGASDNATGCAAVLGVARHLVSLEGRVRNVYFVFFDEEERGLIGSRAFAQMLRDEGRTVVAVHTVDQMGWDADEDGAVELEVPYEGAEELYRRAAEASGFEGAIHTTRETGSDHAAFRRLGFPAVGLTEEYRGGDTTPHIHRPSDTWETVDFEYLARATRLFRTAAAMLVRNAGG